MKIYLFPIYWAGMILLLLGGMACSTEDACQEQTSYIEGLELENNQFRDVIEHNREILTVIGTLMDSLERLPEVVIVPGPPGTLIDRIKAGQDYIDRTKVKVVELEKKIATQTARQGEDQTQELRRLIAELKRELAQKESEIQVLRAANQQLSQENAELNSSLSFIQDSLTISQVEKDSLKKDLQGLSAEKQSLSLELSQTRQVLNSKYFQLGQVEKELANRFNKVFKRNKRIAHLENALGFFETASDLGHLNAKREIVLLEAELKKLRK